MIMKVEMMTETTIKMTLHIYSLHQVPVIGERSLFNGNALANHVSRLMLLISDLQMSFDMFLDRYSSTWKKSIQLLKSHHSQ